MEERAQIAEGPKLNGRKHISTHSPTVPYVKVLYNGKEMNLCGRSQKTCDYAEWKERVRRQFVDYQQLCSYSQKMADS